MLDFRGNEWPVKRKGCVIWPEFVGPPDGGLLDLQLNEMYDFVMSPAKLGFTGFSRLYAESCAGCLDSCRLENDVLSVLDICGRCYQVKCVS